MALSIRTLGKTFHQTCQLIIRPFCTGETTADSKDLDRFPTRVFSGIQPTGIAHIGNYFGAIKNWVKLQDIYEDVIYSIVDMHSITVSQNPVILRDNILSMTACILACGINADKSILFQQSQVPHHTELSWILGCLCTIPRLSHLPTWKEKSAATKEQRVGLFTYPVLQAADILLYKATQVPVGEDQYAHIDLARHLAQSFNSRFGKIFPKPITLLTDVPRIKSLRNPVKKMSKSEVDEKSRINLNDSPDEIFLKISKAVTDSKSQLTYDVAERPGVSNLIGVECAITGRTPEEVCELHRTLDTGEYKRLLADLLIEELAPIRRNIEELMSDKHHLHTVIETGRQKALEIALPNITQVKSLVGFSS